MDNITITQFLSHIRIPLYRNAYALIFSSAITSILGLAYWILAARLYSTEAVGLNSAVVSAMMFLGGVAQLSLNNVLIRFIPLAGQTTYRLAGYAYLISLIAAGVVSAVFLLRIEIWSPALKFITVSPGRSLAFVLTVMAWCIFALQDSVLTGLRQTLWVPVENSIFAILKITLLVSLALHFQQLGIFASWSIPVLISVLSVSLLIFVRLIPRHIQATSERSNPMPLGGMIKFATGNYLASLFFLASTSLLPIIVTNQAGTRANAYFYPAWTIAMALQFIASNLSISFTVEASMDATHLVAQSRHVLIQTIRLLAPIVAVILLGAHVVLSAFGNIYADEGALVLRLLALGTLPNILINLSVGLARVQNRPFLITLIQGVLCVLILGLSLVFLPIFGISGVGFAWIISQASLAIVLVFTELRSILFVKGGIEHKTM